MASWKVTRLKKDCNCCLKRQCNYTLNNQKRNEYLFSTSHRGNPDFGTRAVNSKWLYKSLPNLWIDLRCTLSKQGGKYACSKVHLVTGTSKMTTFLTLGWAMLPPQAASSLKCIELSVNHQLAQDSQDPGYLYSLPWLQYTCPVLPCIDPSSN